MRRAKPFAMTMLCVATCFIAGCGSHDSATPNTSSAAKSDDKILNLFIWSDFLAPDTIPTFEKQTGVKGSRHVSYFDTNETLEAQRPKPLKWHGPADGGIVTRRVIRQRRGSS